MRGAALRRRWEFKSTELAAVWASEGVREVSATCRQVGIITCRIRTMTKSEFFEYAYDQFKLDYEMISDIYSRAGFILTGQVVVGGGLVALGRPDLFWLVFIRVDVFLLFLFTLTACGFLIASAWWLLKAIKPRQNRKPASLPDWVAFREQYARELKATKPEQAENFEGWIAEGKQERLLEEIVKAQAELQKLNECRNQQLAKSIQFAALAAIALLGIALFAFILKVQNVTPA